MGELPRENITWHVPQLARDDRERLMGHPGGVLWFTGLSGSGKSTVANLVDRRLHEANRHTYLLDGDNVRFGLNSNLGFSPDDRAENIRRIGEVARLFVDAGLIVLAAVISPYARDRAAARTRVPEGRFVEVFVDTDLAVCEARDPKGLYKKARAGEIRGFTGIDDPYERPSHPEVHLAAGTQAPEALADRVLEHLRAIGWV